MFNAASRFAGSKFDAAPNAASKLANQPLISTASAGSRPDSELIIGSMMTSSIPSALATGIDSSGPRLNVINVLVAPLRPSTRPTRRSIVRRDCRAWLLKRRCLAMTEPFLGHDLTFSVF
jgi:hypothetical protein